jgi:hypothetical protein
VKLKGTVVKASRKDRFEYQYGVSGTDGKYFTMCVDSRLHDTLLKSGKDPVGRFVEYDTEKDIFRFLD